MTGRLHGTLFGRPVEIFADGRQLHIAISSLRVAWRARQLARGLAPLFRLLRDSNVEMRMQVGSIIHFQILPEPSLLLRSLVPDL